MRQKIFTGFLLLYSTLLSAQQVKEQRIPAGMAWSSNSINTVVFRKNALCSDGRWQYIAFYNIDGQVVLGKRKINSRHWDFRITGLKGNRYDSHNSISIMTDGEGYLHMAWDHHASQLHYTRSVKPGSLELLPPMPMTGLLETAVTYPEFFTLPGGDLLFLYHDGRSGRGNLVMNRYILKQKKWKLLHSNLISGEEQRNAYWQSVVDQRGTIHLSWVWRESPDVATNHDLCYARSDDGGTTWKKSSGETYHLPITVATAEYVQRIPMNSGLINQTSMCVNENNEPLIATYWKAKEDSVVQYKVLYLQQGKWLLANTGFRSQAMNTGGTGTRHAAISRPQLVSWQSRGKQSVALVFRDEAFGNRVSLALTEDISKTSWRLWHSAAAPVGFWEPSYDTELWRRKKRLDLFVLYSNAGRDNDKEMKPSESQVSVHALRFK